MLCAVFGSGSVVVRFFFRFCRELGVVRCCCSSRSAAARLLLRFRAARRWWRSSAAPSLSSASRLTIAPRFSLRWLARRWCRVSVSSPPSSWSSLVPSSSLPRPLPEELLLRAELRV